MKTDFLLIINSPSRNEFMYLDVRVFLAGLLILSTVLFASGASAADDPSFTRVEDVVYGRKFGTALTLDVIAPKQNANGAGIIYCVSGGWFSSHEGVNPAFYKAFLDR